MCFPFFRYPSIVYTSYCINIKNYFHYDFNSKRTLHQVQSAHTREEQSNYISMEIINLWLELHTLKYVHKMFEIPITRILY